MSHHAFFGALAMALTLVGFYPYLRGILSGSTRPHVFSWVIWASTTLVVFFAQIDAGGGVGAWPIGVSGVLTTLIAVLAWRRRGDVSITRGDWVFLVLALSSLPLWYLTDDAMWAVVVLTVVDLLGFGPTFRKVWAAPQSESCGFYGLFALRNAAVVLALEQHSVTTVLFPAGIGTACIGVMLLIAYGRRRAAVRARRHCYDPR